MKTKTLLPLVELSINDLFNGGKATYEVPVYQRNYAWEKEEITALIQDAYDAYITNDKQIYFIGTLVCFQKGDKIYEIIDGQQRLTTIVLVLSFMQINMKNKLTYRARKKSNNTMRKIPNFGEDDEKDTGIVKGYQYVKDALEAIVLKNNEKGFHDFFCHKVHLIRYEVPKDIDLNHYFEIMNSRGEQLEKHEIVKVRLMERLSVEDRATFNRLWEFCSVMNVYIQQKYADAGVFGKRFCDFEVASFDGLPRVTDNMDTMAIANLINYSGSDDDRTKEEMIDTFQPIIDFPNFLLIVLKLTRMDNAAFRPADISLDDKALLKEFDQVQAKGLLNADFAKRFGFNLLKAKYLLDNYLVHHSNESDTVENNPWKLQRWQVEGKKRYLKNLIDDNNLQHKLVQLLSMFEVSFTARQRKNYLFYCLLYLFKEESRDLEDYYRFVSNLADKYLNDVYLKPENLNEINVPKPDSFDDTLFVGRNLDIIKRNNEPNFVDIYGKCTEISKGIPLFIFNYLDYKLWEKYANELRGEGTKGGSNTRSDFFSALGCSDFGLKVFEQFYFSRTRRSLEHYYPQANAKRENAPLTEDRINCLGNYAMIGSDINSSGSNWTPITKLDHYLDASGKIRQVSVASIKFMIMMQKCKDNQNEREPGQEWISVDISEHQEKMLKIMGL